MSKIDKAAKPLKIKSHDALVKDLHEAARSMLRMIGGVHMTLCGGNFGWINCKCELAGNIRRLSDTQFAFSEHQRKLGKRPR